MPYQTQVDKGTSLLVFCRLSYESKEILQVGGSSLSCLAASSFLRSILFSYLRFQLARYSGDDKVYKLCAQPHTSEAKASMVRLQK